MRDFDQTVAGLRAWTKDHDPHVRGAVELLIWHGYWLRRADFRKAAVGGSAVEAWIMWDRAAAFAATGASTASSSERAVLDLATAIGSDRYRLSRMGGAHAEAIVRAVAAALGQEGMLSG